MANKKKVIVTGERFYLDKGPERDRFVLNDVFIVTTVLSQLSVLLKSEPHR